MEQLISFNDHMVTREKGKYADEEHFPFSRAGNRIYMQDIYGQNILVLKCKNATKAKRLWQREISKVNS